MKLVSCRLCKKEVANTAKTCPHCGIKNPGVTKKQMIFNGIMMIIMVLIIVITFTSNKKEEKPFEFTNEGIKGLSEDITNASISKNPKNDKNFIVEIDSNKNPFTGGAQDWNSIAMDSWRISKTLLTYQVDKIDFVFRSPDNDNIDWARITIKANDLPKNWQNLTYLQFFSYSNPIPGTLETSDWLCDFYKKYESAWRYYSEIPPPCRHRSKWKEAR